MTSLQHILQQLFRKENLDEISVEQLEQLTKEHPLFAPAQYLLAMKYKDTGNELFEHQIQRTALHFHNPLWLHFHLSEKGWEDSSMLRAMSELTASDKPTGMEPLPPTHDMIEELIVHQETSTPVILPESSNETVTTPDSTDGHKNPADDAHAGEMYHTNQDAEAIKEAESDAAAAKRIVNDGHSNATAPAPVTGEGPEMQNVSSAEPPLHAPVTQAEKSAGTHPLFSRLKDDDVEDSKVTFEPYHTVDYFASQGIKVGQEVKSDDRLGKQMKSFTEWLRTMRKLPEAKVEAELEKINDTEIQHIAAHSLESREVVTEAMAEVLAKQGRHEQAADMYRKLSLLNPHKSAYFAAKIDSLKNQ